MWSFPEKLFQLCQYEEIFPHSKLHMKTFSYFADAFTP